MSETRLTAVPSRAVTNPMIGAVLGNYRIVGPISTGGMGTVYRARHELLGRMAAVKLLRPELTANDELVQRFFNEAKAATEIKHPGIVEVYDFGYTEEGDAYFVMEFLEGKPLSRALEEVGRFTELEAANIARQIASALKAAHSKHIIHRDLKPDNVFLVPDLEGPTGSRRTKVLDFGVAKLADGSPESRHTRAGVLMGTPAYMAPEQARAAAEIDRRADLYSLGCILYELLVGKPPFEAPGAGEIIAMQLFSQPEPPSAILAEISPEMERIVLRLLAKEPHERFQTAGEVVNALAAVGARLSAELATALPGSGPHGAREQASLSARFDLSSGVRGAASASVPRLEISDPPPAPPQRSALPIVAAVLTAAAIAAIVIVVALTRRGDADAPAPDPAPPPAPASVGAPAPDLPPPPSPPASTAPASTAPASTAPHAPPAATAREETAPPGAVRPPPRPTGRVKRPARRPKPRGPTSPGGGPIYDSLDEPKPTPR